MSICTKWSQSSAKKTRSLALTTVFALFASACAGGGSRGSSDTTNQVPLAPAAAANGISKTCTQVPLSNSNEALDYCFADPAGQGRGSGQSATIVYYFHGLGGNAKDLFEGNDKPLLDAIFQVLGSRAPIVASLSLGPSGVFADDTAELLSSGLPAIENAIAPGKTVRRILLGGSMGGHNVLRLAAQGGPSLFHAAAALCPAIATFNGYNDAEVASYRARNAAVLDNVLFGQAMTAFKKRITDAADWTANNPFTFESQGTYDGLPLFMSVGTEDTLGFLEGSREFVRRASLRPAMNVDYHEISGVHCSFDAPPLLRFLTIQILN